MRYLADTNVVMRFMDRGDIRHGLSRHAIRTLTAHGHEVVVCPQNIIELWNVMTRPIQRNGGGKSPQKAFQDLRVAERIFPIVPDLPDIYGEWRRLVRTYSVSGAQVHDTRLVAVMLTHGVAHILTFNASDFVRFAPEGIVAIDPAAV